MFGAHGSATPGHSRPHSRPLRLTNYAPKSQTNLSAGTCQVSYVYLHMCSIYILSMGKTWSDLLKIMCCIVLPLPPIKPNGPSCLSYLPKHIPPQPNPTQLKYSPPHLYKYDSWLRNRAQTAPPDCSQTRFKSDQKTTPQTDSVYLPPHHHIIV